MIKRLSNEYYKKSPTISTGNNYVTSSTGSIYFNKDKYGASVKINVNLSKSNMLIETWATTTPANYLSTISVILTANKGSGKDVINKSITIKQLAVYITQSPYNTYLLRFVQNSKESWNCYYKLTDYDKQIPPGYQKVNNINTAISSEGKSVDYVKSDKGIYMIPSATHDHTETNYKNNVNTLTMEQLNKQFYDIENDTFVYDLKDYAVGDRLVFEDIINDISYDAKTNTSKLSFKDGESLIVWEFANDLRSQYKKGDEIKLGFNVVEEFKQNGMIFENLDYLTKVTNNETPPNINDYLIK